MLAVYHFVDPREMFNTDPVVDLTVGFSNVAIVKTTLDEVFRLTNHGWREDDWRNNPLVVWSETGKVCSTSVGDVVLDLKRFKAYRVAPSGFQPVGLV